MRYAIVAAVIAAWAGMSSLADAVNEPTVPRCPEDAVVLGVGEFENGMWTGYTCGPARDSYVEVGR